MAVKHIKEYFNDVANQYLALQQEVKEFEEEAEKGLCDPDKIEKLKEWIEPLKDNYLTLSYVMYLLNMPARPQKVKRYEMQNKKLLNSIPGKNTKQGILEQNEEVLKGIKNL